MCCWVCVCVWCGRRVLAAVGVPARVGAAMVAAMGVPMPAPTAAPRAAALAAAMAVSLAAAMPGGAVRAELLGCGACSCGGAVSVVGPSSWRAAARCEARHDSARRTMCPPPS